jgi:hypothetical protein
MDHDLSLRGLGRELLPVRLEVGPDGDAIPERDRSIDRLRRQRRPPEGLRRRFVSIVDRRPRDRLDDRDPVLLLLGVPNVGALMLLIFVSALVPVIGNIVSGVTLSLLAYQQKGWVGVGIFVGLTFVLHKIESYYLNPRLTSRHVKMPGFLLIVSLIACEHLFGFTGLFLSFPILFVAGRVRADFLEEDGLATSSPIDLSDSPDQLPVAPSAEPPSASGMELDR